METKYLIGGLVLTAISLVLEAQPKYEKPYLVQIFRDTNKNALYDTVEVQRFKKHNGKKDGIDVLLEKIETKLPEEISRDQISPRIFWRFNGLDTRIFE